MTERIDSAKVGASTAEVIIGVLYDALSEAADVFRNLSSDTGHGLVAEWERRGLVRPARGQTAKVVVEGVADRLVVWLSGANPPQFGPLVWADLVRTRLNLIQIIAANNAKAEQAFTKPALRGWFVGQLAKTGYDYNAAGKLVTLAFDALGK